MKRSYNRALQVMTNDPHAPKSKLHTSDGAAGVVLLMAFMTGLAVLISQISAV